MDNKFNLGIYTFASILGVVAGGLFVKSKIKNEELNEGEIDELAEQIDIFGEES